MDSFEKLKSLAKDEAYSERIVQVTKELKSRNVEEAHTLIKILFFSPETHPVVRYALAPQLGQINNPQLFNQVLSYLILKASADTLSLIRALKYFARPEAIVTLIQSFQQDNFLPERLEILDALASIHTPETIEFLSQVYNNQINYEPVPEPKELQMLREHASSALSKCLMRFD